MKNLRLGLLIAMAAAILSTPALAADKLKAIGKPKFDPKADKVELFKGLKAGEFEAMMIPKNALGGNLFVMNKTKKPLTVLIPKGFVGVQKQIVGGGGGIPGGGFGGGGFGQGGLGGGGFGGGSQPLGGGLGGGGFGGGGFGGGLGGGGIGGGGGIQPGGGFFSIPPGRTVRVPYRSVCLAHGKPDPTPRHRYQLMPVDNYTKDKALAELIEYIGSSKVDPGTAQAAAWHLTDKLSWRQLAAKKITRIGGFAKPFFHPAQVLRAQAVVAAARKAGEKRKDPKPAEPTTSAVGKR